MGPKRSRLARRFQPNSDDLALMNRVMMKPPRPFRRLFPPSDEPADPRDRRDDEH
jgi:hypothetical protein